MSEKRFCIICGKEIHSSDPMTIYCEKHAGMAGNQPSPSKPLPENENREKPTDLSQLDFDITEEWQKDQVLLDTYQVIGKLGQGGMGRVYRVHHKDWNMDLAVKQPLASIFTKPKGKADFIREAETWVDLGLHPHITSCFYVRTIQDIPLIFVEYMDGGSLEHWIQRKGHDLYAGTQGEILQRILDIAIQFAWGLAYAHDCSLVHQDVKPLNVLMTSDGIVKVTDFGLAKARAKAGEITQNAGARGLVSGSMYTVAYRSPEQARGDPLDQTTDIWSWAVSIMEMFKGGVSWQDGQAAPTSLESYFKYPDDNPIPRMPAGLGDLLRQCFQKAPDDRPKDMLEITKGLVEIYHEEIGQDYPREKPDVTELRADSLNNKALTMLDLGSSEQAEALLEEALAADNQHVSASYNLGLLRWRSARATDIDVLQNLKQIQQDQPEDSNAASALGWVCLESGRINEALAYFEQANHQGEDSNSKSGLAMTRSLAERGAGTCIRTLNGHEECVNCVTFIPNECKALSGSEDQTLKLWDLATGECLRTFGKNVFTFEERKKPVYAVAVSPDGNRAISTSRRMFKLWDLTTGECLYTFDQHTDRVLTVAFSQDGHQALSGSRDKTLKLWDLTTRQCLHTFEGHASSVISVAFSPDGHQALSGSSDCMFRLWDLDQGECLYTFMGNAKGISSLAFSPDGNQALSGSVGEKLQLWDFTAKRCLRTIEGHTNSVYHIYAVAFNPNGSEILSGSSEKTLKLWDLPTGRCLRTFEGHTNGVESVAFSQDGHQALSGSLDKTLKLWDLSWLEESHRLAPLRYARGVAGSEASKHERTHGTLLQKARKELKKRDIASALSYLEQARGVPGFERESTALALGRSLGAYTHITGSRGGWETLTFNGHIWNVESVALSPDGSQGLSGSDDKSLKLWDLANGECLHTFVGHTGRVESVAVSPDGRLAVSGSFDKTLKLWDLSKGECLRTLRGHEWAVNSVVFSPDGRLILSGSLDQSLKLWNLATGECLRTLTGHTKEIYSVTFSPDGLRVLSGGSDKTLKLWDLATGDCLQTFTGHTGSVRSVSFHPDGSRILSGSEDRTLKLWDLLTGTCLHTFTDHTKAVISVVFSPDGRWALSGSYDKTLKLWELAKGECLRTFEGHKYGVYSVTFSPDGREILSGSGGADETIKLWSLDWEVEFPGWADWNESARPYLETFLILHTPYAGKLSKKRAPSEKEITLALTHRGKPTWTEDDFKGLLMELGHRGYGWLREDGVRNKLKEMAGER